MHIQTYKVGGGEELRNISQGITNTTRLRAGLAAYPNITTEVTMFLVAGAQLASLFDHASHTIEFLDTCAASGQSNFTCEISTSGLDASQIYFLLIQNLPDVTATTDKLNIISIVIPNPLGEPAGSCPYKLHANMPNFLALVHCLGKCMQCHESKR